ncbi:MAG: DUF190 domain-containing protein [Bacteroidales bacterium]|nr:DUF190 domain-containing protein [Bacteroidales bacterium]
MMTDVHGSLKIYASTTDKIGAKLLYEHIVYLAKEKGICGVTVFRGVMGYGLSSRHISSSKFWELTDKLPVVIEIIDTQDKLEEFYQMIEPGLSGIAKGCMVTLQPVTVKLLRSGKGSG